MLPSPLMSPNIFRTAPVDPYHRGIGNDAGRENRPGWSTIVSSACSFLKMPVIIPADSLAVDSRDSDVPAYGRVERGAIDGGSGHRLCRAPESTLTCSPVSYADGYITVLGVAGRSVCLTSHSEAAANWSDGCLQGEVPGSVTRPPVRPPAAALRWRRGCRCASASGSRSSPGLVIFISALRRARDDQHDPRNSGARGGEA